MWSLYCLIYIVETNYFTMQNVSERKKCITNLKKKLSIFGLIHSNAYELFCVTQYMIYSIYTHNIVCKKIVGHKIKNANSAIISNTYT